MIDFILGDAGAGKSYYVYEWLCREAEAHPDRQYYLFVPEQNTLGAQREMIRHSPRHGMLNADVLSFQLLAYRVMEELGIGKPVILDEVGKSVLIRKAVLESAQELRLYRQKIHSPGFIKQLGSIFSEFCQYDTDIDSLLAAGENSELPLLRDKLHDICLIYRCFREKLEAKAAIPEDVAYVLLANLRHSHLLDGATVVLDGFTGFTPIQMNILEHLIPRAARVRVSVTIPPEANPFGRGQRAMRAAPDMFLLSRETIDRLCLAAEKNNVGRGAETVIQKRHASADVRIVAADDPNGEVRLAVRDIRRNALLHGVRYKQMAVVVSDPETYNELLKSEMEKEGIPCFLDDRAPALGNPAVEYVRAALRAVTGNYRADDLMAFFRNPLVTPDEDTREQADLFDNDLRKTGFRGRRALEGQVLPFEPAWLFALEDGLRSTTDIAGMTAVIRTFCEDSALWGRAAAYADRLEAAGLLRQAMECRQLAVLIPGLFDRVSLILGEDTAEPEEFCRLIDAGFREMKGGTVPETMDMVMVGDLRRSRFGEIERLYVLGANEGLIPSAVTGGGIFTDRERSEILKAEIALAPDDRKDSLIQNFYLRLLLNKPKKQLILLYAGSGRDNRPLRPSGMLAELQAGEYGQFRHIELSVVDDSSLISSANDGLLSFSEQARRDSAKYGGFYELYRALLANGKEAELSRILHAAALTHGNDRLSGQAADALYRGMLEGSVTRMETYEGCPFSQFARYGLELKEREKHEIEVTDIGILYHRVLDRVFAGIKAMDTDITALPDTVLDGLCAEAAEAVISEYHEDILHASARNRYISDKLLRTAKRTLRILKMQFQAGEFRTDATELAFRRAGDGMVLHGVIDRMDSVRADGKEYVRVIDYKSGKKEFSLSELLNGTELQLITYLDNALRQAEARHGGTEALPAGMFYYHIEDPVIPYVGGMTGEEAEERKRSALRMNGAVMGEAGTVRKHDRGLPETAADGGPLSRKEMKASTVISERSEILSGEEFERLMRFAADRMQKDADSILSGDIQIRPYRSDRGTRCDYCPYRSVCRFDTEIEGFRYRNAKKYGRDDAMELLSAAGAAQG